MREPMIVDHAPHIPCACCVCTNQTGPFADTFFEDRAGRKYVCKRCAKSHARVFGFSAGKRMDELSDAASLVEAKDAELAKAQATIEELRLANGGERATVKDLRSRLEDATGKLQLTGKMAASVEQQAHELVEAVAPRSVVEAVA